MGLACDCSVGDYEPLDIIEDKFVTARKVHKCGECREDILPGQRYEIIKGTYDGEFETHKTCVACVAIRSDFCKHGYIFGELRSQIEECLGIDYMQDPKDMEDEVRDFGVVKDTLNQVKKDGLTIWEIKNKELQILARELVELERSTRKRRVEIKKEIKEIKAYMRDVKTELKLPIVRAKEKDVEALILKTLKNGEMHVYDLIDSVCEVIGYERHSMISNTIGKMTGYYGKLTKIHPGGGCYNRVIALNTEDDDE